jgi:hypothetical protein
MMREPFRRLALVTLVAPLGLRFRDVVTNTFVNDGLSVTVYPQANPLRRVLAFANRTGVYVLHHAPGLSAFEHGAGDDAFWAGVPQGQPFIVEVEDTERRFLPFKLTLNLPQKGIYNWVSPLPSAAQPLSPPASVAPIPLYSAPTRSTPAGVAVLRAELWDPQTQRPAAWAVIEARVEDLLLARGIADERGRLALIFPYPPPQKFSVTSPVGSPVDASPPAPRGPSIYEQEWRITLSAGYAPLASPPSPPDVAGVTATALPDLNATLAQLNQPPANLWLDFAQHVRLLAVTLRYGRELVLQSEDSINHSPPAPPTRALFITPAV